jgi:hypothetical protein
MSKISISDSQKLGVSLLQEKGKTKKEAITNPRITIAKIGFWSALLTTISSIVWIAYFLMVSSYHPISFSGAGWAGRCLSCVQPISCCR